ncbi:hypothetical protein GCM10023094_48530 [Rhodococcus olei]|uniref:SHOCT domain-containing protein n=1 Tax=Rhodococcus olei TaxID=2161675 RepID=A0ABP8PL13_9NOCA
MTAAYGQVTTGYWPVVVIGIVLLSLAATAIVTVRCARRRHDAATLSASTAPPTAVPSTDVDDPYTRCRALIAETLIVRERVSGQIDAATYQARMNELASGRHEGTDHVER